MKKISVQKMNKGKIAIFLDHNASQELEAKVSEITRIHRKDFPLTYLKVPIYNGKTHYKEITDKVFNRFN